MKTLAATALLLVLGSVPVQAQFGGTTGGARARPAARREENVQVKLREIAQEVDETLLREAMLSLGRLEMTPKPGDEISQKRRDSEKETLEQFIKQKTLALTERAADMAKARAESVASQRPPVRANRPEAQENPRQSEEIEKAKVEVQLLQSQVETSRLALQHVINALAEAEFMAEDDDTKRGKAESARKTFEKVKAVHVEYSKRLGEETSKLNALAQGSMGGGFR